ncbi:MAG TPA: hypothetical protein VFU62_14430 [Hanamia sp.]|jgi:hypothetical protein|nr:hypothetical protein [Hanamia sp.]
MTQKYFTLSVLLFCSSFLFAQNKKDTTVRVDENYITLSEIVVNNKLDVASFVQRVKNDTTFYKAFRNLRIIGYTALNDIRMLDKNGKILASLRSKTKQIRTGNCRKMETIDQTVSGDMFDNEGNFNYYTAQMYAGLFFTKDSVCGENNIVKGHEFSTAGLSGMEKHKEQLKMLFFNPGKRINGLPFISNKTAIFDPSMADDYDMDIDYKTYDSIPCYVFSIKVKNDKKSDVVIDEMTTWFNEKTFEIVARNYSLSYDAGFYDFSVDMEVQMQKVGNLLVPAVLKYNGNWKAIFKKRERGVFTATLFDFVK